MTRRTNRARKVKALPHPVNSRGQSKGSDPGVRPFTLTPVSGVGVLGDNGGPFPVEPEAMSESALARYAATPGETRGQGLFKAGRIITSPQSGEIALADARTVLNLCATNYLGLPDHPGA